jgi:signal transduction histidine kinase
MPRQRRPAAIQFHLATIVALAVITSALAVMALMRAFEMTEEHRLRRVTDRVTDELAQLARMPRAQDALSNRPPSTFVGLRAGWVARPQDFSPPDNLPTAWRAALARTIEQAAAQQAQVVTNSEVRGSVLVLAARPAVSGGLTWVGFLIPPSYYLARWRWIVFGLAMATGLLVITTLWAILAFRRNTRSLHDTLVALGKDLTTTVPEPQIAGLVGIADGIRGMARDLLSAREAEARLVGELTQKDRLAALGRVVAGVAHEVRNPLASIKLRLDLTAAAHELPEPARQAIEAASTEILRLDRLVSDLLVIAGKRTGPLHKIDLGLLCRERVEALRPWAQAAGVEVRADGEAAAAADPAAVARAIDNLLRNAVEASPRGATVDVHLRTADSSVLVDVTDRGPGVAPARERELFEPFFTTKADGTGLGLAITRAIARAHGGELSYGREQGMTRFRLALPASGTATA